MGGWNLRRARGDHPPHRRRIPRSRQHRRDDRDRRQDPAVPAGGGDARQVGQQRLGRLRMLLVAHRARRPRRRARESRRHARHDGAPQPSAGQSPSQREAGRRRLHDPAFQSDRQQQLAACARDAQPAHDAGADRRPQRRLEPGAGPDATRLDVPGEHAGRLDHAQADLSGNVDPLSLEPGDLVLGDAPPRRRRRAFPVHGRLRLYGGRNQLHGRPAAAGSLRPRVRRS